VKVERQVHVDVVKNDWQSGEQVRLVAVEATPEIRLSHVRAGWSDLLTRKLIGSHDHEIQLNEVSSEPSQVWEALHRNFAGSFVFATEPHDITQCPFNESDLVEMKLLPVPAVND
jgi:hypothetical protein